MMARRRYAVSIDDDLGRAPMLEVEITMHTRVLRFGLAVSSVALAMTLALLVPAPQEGVASILLLAAVVVSTWFAGRWPGLVAAGLAGLSSAWLLLLRTDPGGVGSNDWVQLGVFVLVTLAMYALAAGRDQEAGVLRRSRDDLEHRVEVRTSELHDANEALHAGAEVRKRAEEALSQVAAIEASTEDAVFTMSRDGKIVSCNPGAEKLYGYTTAELVGRSIAMLLPRHRSMALPRMLERVSRGESIAPFEAVRLRTNGTRIQMLLTISPIKDATGSVRGVCALVRDITRRKQAESKIAIYQQQLRCLASALSFAEQRERRRIASELHGHLAQMLIVSRIKVRMLQSTFVSESAPQPMEEIRQLLDKSIEYTRTLIWDLCPPMLHEVGLEAALEWLAEQMQERHGIDVRFEDDEQLKPSDENIRVLLFQAVHELLMNVIKHASASQAIVAVRKCEEQIEIRVEDNGAGFDPEAARARIGQDGGFGLFSIRERLDTIGGSFAIRSDPGLGSQATLRAPLLQGAGAASRKGALHSHPDLVGR
jgi:PAS domain S-box-containing protein